MTKRHPERASPASDGRGHGFFDAPWWRLLLWAVIFVVAVVLAEELGILG